MICSPLRIALETWDSTFVVQCHRSCRVEREIMLSGNVPRRLRIGSMMPQLGVGGAVSMYGEQTVWSVDIRWKDGRRNFCILSCDWSWAGRRSSIGHANHVILAMLAREVENLSHIL